MKKLMNRHFIVSCYERLALGAMPSRPKSGWIRTIRKALGMTTTPIGKDSRSGSAKSECFRGSRARRYLEDKNYFEEAAQALNCKLVYFFIPNEPLDAMLKKRAYAAAKRRLDFSTHSMDLEAQGISFEEKQQQIEELANELLTKRAKELWDEE